VRFQITSGKFITAPDRAGWSAAHDFAGGDLIAITEGSEATTEVIPGRNILTFLHEKFTTDHELNTFVKLTTIASSAISEFSGKHKNLSLLLACFAKGAIYITGVGTVSVYILRNKTLTKVFSGAGNVKTVSGFIKEGDVMLLGTDSFIKSFDTNLISSAMSLGSATAAIEHLKSHLHTRDDKGNYSAMVVKIGKSVVEENLPKIHAEVKAESDLRPIVVSPFRRKLANFLDKVIAKLPHEQQPIFVKDELGELKNTKKRKVTVTVGIALLALLLISIIFGVKQNKNSSIRSRYDGRLTDALGKFEEAKSLGSLNQSRARELILGAKSEAQQLESEGVKDERLTKLLSDINSGLGSIAGIYTANPDLYLDLSLVSSGFKGDVIGASDGRMAVLDKTGKKLVGIDIATKRTEVVAGPDVMPDATEIAPYSDKNYVLASDGVWEVGDKAQVDIKSDWKSDSLIFAYSGNIYILDKSAGVFRYSGLGGGTFGTKQNWFGPGIKPDLTNARAWIIDGSIWILTNSGQILKFKDGAPIAFSLKDTGDISPTKIYTNEELKYLYLLDSTNSQVLVTDKNGNYKATYLVSSAKGATGLIVSETEKKIILLNDTKLYSVEIRHLGGDGGN